MGTERFERSTSPKEIQLCRLTRPTDIRLMPVVGSKSLEERARLERARPEGRRFSKPVGYLLPNLSDYPISPKNWRRVGDSNSYAPKLRRFSGPVGHHLPVPSVWRLVTESNGLFGFSDRLCHPTRSNQPCQKNFAGGSTCARTRALVPEEGIEPPCRSAGS